MSFCGNPRLERLRIAGADLRILRGGKAGILPGGGGVEGPRKGKSVEIHILTSKKKTRGGG